MRKKKNEKEKQGCIKVGSDNKTHQKRNIMKKIQKEKQKKDRTLAKTNMK